MPHPVGKGTRVEAQPPQIRRIYGANTVTTAVSSPTTPLVPTQSVSVLQPGAGVALPPTPPRDETAEAPSIQPQNLSRFGIDSARVQGRCGENDVTISGHNAYGVYDSTKDPAHRGNPYWRGKVYLHKGWGWNAYHLGKRVTDENGGDPVLLTPREAAMMLDVYGPLSPITLHEPRVGELHVSQDFVTADPDAWSEIIRTGANRRVIDRRVRESKDGTTATIGARNEINAYTKSDTLLRIEVKFRGASLTKLMAGRELADIDPVWMRSCYLSRIEHLGIDKVRRAAPSPGSTKADLIARYGPQRAAKAIGFHEVTSMDPAYANAWSENPRREMRALLNAAGVRRGDDLDAGRILWRLDFDNSCEVAV